MDVTLTRPGKICEITNKSDNWNILGTLRGILSDRRAPKDLTRKPKRMVRDHLETRFGQHWIKDRRSKHDRVDRVH
jgi:hypothetical protein